MKCLNRNLKEYKVLSDYVGGDILANIYINKWQEANNTDKFPTINQMANFLSIIKKEKKESKEDFKNKVLNNLVELNFITKSGDRYIILNDDYANGKMELVRRFLYFNNINPEVIEFEKSNDLYNIKLNTNKLNVISNKDFDKNNESPRTVNVIEHLRNLFPDIEIMIYDETQAKKYYDSLPEEEKARVSFKDINAFHINGKVVLIKGRVTNETAIEEVLHPFINYLYNENRNVFNSLLKESANNFPELKQAIDNSYTEDNGFDQNDRNLELVTQALTKYFKKEYEKKPTSALKNRIREFIIWFSKIINDLYVAITGLDLNITPLMIQENTDLSSLAKKLNTEVTRFNPNLKPIEKVQYSLSSDRMRAISKILESSNDLQKAIVNKLLKLAMTSNYDFEKFFASNNIEGQTEYQDLLGFDEDSHTYINLGHVIGEGVAEYTPTSTIIKGEMDPNKQDQFRLNLEIGNYFDTLMNNIAEGVPFEEIKNLPQLEGFDKGKEAYDYLYDLIQDIIPKNSVIIPQVIVYNREAMIAGTIDLLVITPKGKLQIIDLKTSKNSITDSRNNRYDINWKLEGDREVMYNGEKVPLRGSSLLQYGMKTLSTRQQHNLQVNMYRRMLELMGYKMDDSEQAASTIHIKVNVEEREGRQFFTGEYESEGLVMHPPSQNRVLIDKILKNNVNSTLINELNEISSIVPEAPIPGNTIITEEESQIKEEVLLPLEQQPIYKILNNYKEALMKKNELINNLRSNIYMDKTSKQTSESILNTIAIITLAGAEGPNRRSALYTTLLTDALKQIKSFKEYVEDPNNFNKEEYIGYVINFNRFAETFRSLYEVKDSNILNKTQIQLVFNLQTELNNIVGTKNEEGLIDRSITNYVKEYIRTNSKRDLTESDLDDLLAMTTDLSDASYKYGETASSSDTLLALMDKLVKNKKQEVYDVIDTFKVNINTLAKRLQDASSEKDPQKLFHYMIEFDENGLPTGEIITETGDLYVETKRKLRDALIDENGVWKKYRPVIDIKYASEADINYNIALAKAKEAYRKFMQAEQKGNGKEPISGEYHSYTQEFIDLRSRYETYITNGRSGYWVKKRGVTRAQYEKYKAKHFDTIEYTKAIRVNGVLTGQVLMGQEMLVPKKKYIKINKNRYSDGKSLQNPKFLEIMNNTDTELGKAQKEFYLEYSKQMKILLDSLPPGIRYSMAGRIPLIRSKLYNNLKSKPNIVTRLWTKMTRNVDNLTTETNTQKLVVTNELGEIIDSLPVYYTGKLKDENDLKQVIDEIDSLHELRKNGKIDKISYKKKLKELNTKRLSIENSIGADELNLDLATGLVKFAGMSEHYRIMSGAEDTLKAMVKAIENRKYTPADKGKLRTYIGGKQQETSISGAESNMLRRAKKFMHMVYYDNDQLSRNFFDKVADGLINQTSLSYIAFNVFGNMNNYILGRLNNHVEALGGRFTKKESYVRAVKEYNKRFIPGLIERTAYPSIPDNVKDLFTLNLINYSERSAYDPDKPLNKYEAFIDLFRMLDNKGDIREQTKGADSTYKSLWSKFKEFGYMLQDAGEYNVQTKLGMSIVIDQVAINEETGETLSLYDAMDFDGGKQELVLRDGFKIQKKDGTIVEFDNAFRYNLRNYIREVIKEAQGSYAYEDRVVAQASTQGKLIFQFHKWVIPALKARFRSEYFDENLGWMEGRYISFYKFIAFIKEQVANGNLSYKDYLETYSKDNKQAYLMNLGKNENLAEEYAETKMQNVKRTLADIGLMITTFILKQIFQSLFSGDEDDSDLEKRFENILMYQADRTLKELTVFVPVLPSAYTQTYEMLKSPLASAKVLGEFGGALELTVKTPIARLVEGKEGFYADSDYVYQRRPKKGQLKLAKEWKDVIPILYSIQKWDNYLEERDFYIK